MTIKELHIGIDLLLKLYNHNLLGRLLPQEKDYILNKVIGSLIHKTAEDAKHNIVSIETYADIGTFYNIIEPYLIRKNLEIINEDIYVKCKLPKFLTKLAVLGSEIIADVEYKVEQVGNINTLFTGIGFAQANYIEGSVLTLPSTPVTNVISNLTIYKDVKYKILRADNCSFLSYGSTSDDVNTIFLCTSNHTFSGTGETSLQVISYIPSIWSAIILISLKSYSIYDYISASTLISTNSRISLVNNVSLYKGRQYRVIQGGSFEDLTDWGSEYNVVEPGYIFTCTVTGTPSYSTDSTAMLELLTRGICRLSKPQDIYNFLEHSYGTTVTSPLVTLGDGHIQVYHDNKFDIVSVELTYIREPNQIDSITNSETDLNSNLHSKIIELAVQDIISTQQPQLYPVIENQVSKA